MVQHRQNWTDAQQETHDLIKSLHNGGMGYRKIAQYLNERDIKTARGNSWKNTQVFSVLKRYRQRQNREEVRKTLFDMEFGKIELPSSYDLLLVFIFFTIKIITPAADT